MIRKISVQDVVPKRTAKSGRSVDEPTASDTNRRERDFLIERLSRKRTTSTVVAPAVKTTKTRTRSSGGNFKKFGFRNKWFWFGLPIVLIIILFVVLQFMVSAVLTVTPKKLTVQVDTKLVASLSATSSPNTLAYQIITLNASDDETVAATGTVSTKPQKASGQISIFNSYSSAPQTLISNTRFETTDGLIYRTQNTIVVPGMTTAGGKTVPGSITVKVVADQTGSKYNIDTVDFTIPGFKTDSSRYTKIFGRSKTTMTGGSDGNSLGVSEADRQTAQTNIETRLRDSLLKQAQSQKTVDSVIFDAASKISFQHLPDTAGVDPKHVIIHEQGTISSVAFDKKMLGKLFLTDAITKVGNSAEIHGIESLHFIAAVSSTTPIWQAKPFNFTLTGPVDVVGVVNTNKLLQDIEGIPQTDLFKVLANYPTIEKVNVVLKPFWKSSFPKDSSKIKIDILK